MNGDFEFLESFGATFVDPRHSTSTTLSNGQIAAVKVSLVSPFYGLCLAVLKKINQARRTPDANGFIQARSLRTMSTNISCLTQCLAEIAASVQNRLSKGDRPAVVCEPPSWGDASLSWVYPMGTFDGLNTNSLPDVFKRFAVPVWQPGCGLDDDDALKTVPSWKCSKVDAHGHPRTQWFIGIPVELDNGERPTKPWTPGYGKRPYTVQASSFREIEDRCVDNMQDFFIECMREPWRLDQFYKGLRIAEQVRPPSQDERHSMRSTRTFQSRKSHRTRRSVFS